MRRPLLPYVAYALAIATGAAIAMTPSACDKGTRDSTEPVPVEDNADKTPDPDPDHGADAVTIEATKIADNIYMLTGRGGNIGVSVGADGILIIDDQFAELADQIRAKLAELDKGELRYVLNTHFHGDHTGGNPVLGKTAAVVAHDNVRKRLISEGMDAAGWPVITFDQTLTVHFNGEPIRAVHFASGHTNGDSIIFFDKANVVHMGDHFFNGRFPFVDLNSGGTVQGYATNVARVLETIGPDTKIIPGHGPLATRADLEAFSQMLAETTAIVREQVEQGKSLAQVKKKGLPAKWKTWGSGFISTERWLETLYKSLSASPG